MSNKTHITIGISGGVDSSVSALLLKEQGYPLHAVFMKNWEGDDDDEYCAAEDDLKDARHVCEQLGIEIQGVNFADQYWDRVFAHFLEEYKAGRTPNPDILCNKEIKFKAFLDYAIAQGAEKIATGHYARIREVNGTYQLLRGVDTNKDQSYFLYALDQHQLKHSLFPIGELEKDKVRELAKQHNLITHNKKDSTGICFIGERQFKTFLQKYLPAQRGEIRDFNNNVLGKHDGLMYYTRGQRQGLRLGGIAGSSGEPWYAAKKDLQNNILYVAQGKNDSSLYSQWLTADELHWVSDIQPELPIRLSAKTRYRQQDVPCDISQKSDGSYLIEFDEPQWAVTPGQSVVLYDSEVCLGGGVISTAEFV